LDQPSSVCRLTDFLHATALVLVHGWPRSVWEFHKVIGPLDPTAYGGKAEDAFTS
jgi:hypothetical protein